MPSNPASDGDKSTSHNLLDLLSQAAFQLGRIADHFDPPPPDIVDTNVIATSSAAPRIGWQTWPVTARFHSRA